ncbi:MAG TPA: hypothetical protein VNA87_06405, partial [Actinomycetota bacterium]|nr:hypothetical protein [Actinomycetota bacterium]
LAPSSRRLFGSSLPGLASSTLRPRTQLVYGLFNGVLVESLRVAVRSAQEAQLGRGGLGPQPSPPPLRTACENLQKAYSDASALAPPHPAGYDQAVQRAGSRGSACLSELANISAARPSTQVIPAIEAELRQALSDADAYRPK